MDTCTDTTDTTDTTNTTYKFDMESKLAWSFTPSKHIQTNSDSVYYSEFEQMEDDEENTYAIYNQSGYVGKSSYTSKYRLESEKMSSNVDVCNFWYDTLYFKEEIREFRGFSGADTSDESFRNGSNDGLFGQNLQEYKEFVKKISKLNSSMGLKKKSKDIGVFNYLDIQRFGISIRIDYLVGIEGLEHIIQMFQSDSESKCKSKSTILKHIFFNQLTNSRLERILKEINTMMKEMKEINSLFTNYKLLLENYSISILNSNSNSNHLNALEQFDFLEKKKAELAKISSSIQENKIQIVSDIKKLSKLMLNLWKKIWSFYNEFDTIPILRQFFENILMMIEASEIAIRHLYLNMIKRISTQSIQIEQLVARKRRFRSIVNRFICIFGKTIRLI